MTMTHWVLVAAAAWFAYRWRRAVLARRRQEALANWLLGVSEKELLEHPETF